MPLEGRRLIEAQLFSRSETSSLSTFSIGSPSIPVAQVGIPIPEAMKDLPRGEMGYLVPYFVAWVDGKPDFRCADPAKFTSCILDRVCWICGNPLDVNFTFVLGPMCCLNRTTAEPPCHIDCARYAVQVCPFLASSRMRRNEKDLPENTRDPGGFMIRRNPGVSLLWTTDGYSLYRMETGPLFEIGSPLAMEWWSEGRPSTKAEVLQSAESGFRTLLDLAMEEGPEAVSAFAGMKSEALNLIDLCFRNEVIS